MKNYIGISRDHSGSMSSLRSAASKDYNDVIQSLKNAALSSNIETILSVVMCGVRESSPVEFPEYQVGVVSPIAAVTQRAPFNQHTPRTINKFETINCPVQNIPQISSYQYTTDGISTPLFDSVGLLIDTLKSVPDANDPNVSFLVMVVTDGEENSSKNWNARSISAEIRVLQSTDRWTFVFRVPFGKKQSLVNLGIPAGNILEWEQTDFGMEKSSVITRSSIGQYYVDRSVGATCSTAFFADPK